MFTSGLCNKTTILSALAAAICAWVLLNRQILDGYFRKTLRKDMFTSETLSKFDGIQEEQIYLAILGSVVDVSKGAQHYTKPSSYHYFAGKDGSRSFVTGNFADESDEKDHVLDLSCSEIEGINSWKGQLKKKYIYKGKLIGRYYDEEGEPTEYSKQLDIKISNCKMESATAEKFKQRYPPCNIEWDAEKGTRVWCTKDSGGVKRNWVGVPRQLFKPDLKDPMCVCLNLSADNSKAMYREYQGCPSNSESCYIKV